MAEAAGKDWPDSRAFTLSIKLYSALGSAIVGWFIAGRVLK